MFFMFMKIINTNVIIMVLIMNGTMNIFVHRSHNYIFFSCVKRYGKNISDFTYNLSLKLYILYLNNSIISIYFPSRIN